MEGMKLNDWFQKEFYQIDLFVFCMLVSKHGFLVIRKPFCKCCLFNNTNSKKYVRDTLIPTIL